MAHNEFYVAEIPAVDVAKRMAALAADVSDGTVVAFTLNTNVGGIGIASIQVAGKELLNAINPFVAQASQLEFLTCQGASLKLQPGAGGHSSAVEWARSKDDLPILKLTQPESAPPGLLSSLGKHFNLRSRGASLGAMLPKPEQELIRYRESVVADLEAAVGRIGRFLEEQIERQSRHIEQVTVDLQARHAEREKALDEQARKQREELEADRRKLEEERAQWDTQQRMAARRKLKSDLLEQLEKQEKMQVSDETAQKRGVIHRVCLAVLALAIVCAGFGLWLVFRQPDPQWRHFIPFSASAILFGSTLYFYLKWNNHWSAVFADAEVSVRRMKVDVIRANWIAELFLESKETKQIDLPPELVTQLSKNLFADPTVRDRDLHPLDGVFNTIRRAKSIQLAPGAVTIEQHAPSGRGDGAADS